LTPDAFDTLMADLAPFAELCGRGAKAVQPV
jgi:hypothetical protein